MLKEIFRNKGETLPNRRLARFHDKEHQTCALFAILFW
jgi:hypothetical protein